MSRPVGVALLMAGIDHGNRPVLYHLDPSGERRRGCCGKMDSVDTAGGWLSKSKPFRVGEDALLVVRGLVPSSFFFSTQSAHRMQL